MTDIPRELLEKTVKHLLELYGEEFEMCPYCMGDYDQATAAVCCGESRAHAHTVYSRGTGIEYNETTDTLHVYNED